MEATKAANRLIVAPPYNDDVNVTAASSRYGIPQSTIYYWIDWSKEQPLKNALETNTGQAARPNSPQSSALISNRSSRAG